MSFLFHFIFLISLIQFPQLLQGGRYYHYRVIPLLASIIGQDSEDEDESWRTVTVLRSPSSMTAPSAATLKKYMQGVEKEGPAVPPIRLSWGDVEISRADLPPMPRIQQEAEIPDISLPPNEYASAGSSPSPETDEGTAVASPSPKEPASLNESSEPQPKTEVASNIPPSKIPDSIPPPEIPSAPEETIKVFEDEQKAIRSPDSGFFDTKGFPLGEYTNLIVERIKGKWFIPSNLRNSQGNTTVIFYIDRDGHFMNARIVMSSGSNSLDLAALNAVIESNPFPPLPDGFPGDHVGAKFIFSYNEPK
jgi:protein TonB